MKMKDINSVIVAPVFFFLGSIMFLFAALSTLVFFSHNTSFIVVGCITFVLGYNAFRFAMKIKNVE